MTTDLRDALREAADALSSEAANKRVTIHAAVFGDGIPSRYDAIAARCRALADAPPTVAELLARVDAGHEVRWSDADGDEWRAIHVDSDGGSRIAIEMRSRDKQDNWWFTHYPLASDFLLPARLVEVSP